MANGFGLSFAPMGRDTTQSDARPPGGDTGMPSAIQDAIRILSLRIPRGLGPSPLAPAPLLHSAGAGALPGRPGGISLQQLLELIFGQMARRGQAIPRAPSDQGGRPVSPGPAPYGPATGGLPPSAMQGPGMPTVPSTPSASASAWLPSVTPGIMGPEWGNPGQPIDPTWEGPGPMNLGLEPLPAPPVVPARTRWWPGMGRLP